MLDREKQVTELLRRGTVISKVLLNNNNSNSTTQETKIPLGTSTTVRMLTLL